MEPFIGQIIMFGGNFAPRGWALCDGQLLAISSHSALFSILGTTYGGDGRSTFGLPDLRSRVPMHAGTGPGLSNRRLGTAVGQEHVTLTAAQIPSHSHVMKAGVLPPNASTGTDAVLGAQEAYTTTTDPLVDMSSKALGEAGGGQSHDNIQPSLTVNFIIATEGLYPSRS